MLHARCTGQSDVGISRTRRGRPGLRIVLLACRLRPFRGSLTSRKAMKAKSKQQQKAAGAALSAKRGETKKASLKGASKEMCESMSEGELEDMASSTRKDKPRKKS